MKTEFVCNICNTVYSNKIKYCKNQNCLNINYFYSIGYLESEISRKCMEESQFYILAEKYKNKLTCNNKTHKKYWIERGCTIDEAKLIIYQRFKKSTLEYWIDRGYTLDIAKNKMNDFNNKFKLEINNFINRGYTTDEAIIKINEKKKFYSENSKKNYKKSNTILCKEYWIKKGYTLEDAIKQIKLQQKNRFNHLTSNDYSKISKENYKKLKENSEKYEKYIQKLSKSNKQNIYKSPIFKEYWIKKGYTITESKQKAYIARLGDVKYSKHRTSKIEMQCLNELQQYLNITINRGVWRYINNDYFCYDGKINNFIIEFNGTNFHMDERFYNDNDKNPVGVSFNDIKNKDKNKINKSLTKYNIIIIWEYDYLNNKEKLFNKIKNIIQNTDENSKKTKCWSSDSI